MKPEIVPFAPSGDGRRNVGVYWPGRTILVKAESEHDPMEIAEWLAHLPEKLQLAEERIEQLETEAAELRSRVPPATPRRLMGVGCLRERDGKLWLLANSTKGWSAFGIMLDGWDDLFRRFDVVVNPPNQDEHGQWWPVENRPEPIGAAFRIVD